MPTEGLKECEGHCESDDDCKGDMVCEDNFEGVTDCKGTRMSGFTSNGFGMYKYCLQPTTDCEVNWSNLSACDKRTGFKTMTQWDSIVTFPKNKGNSCPNAPPTEPCDVDCEYKDKSDWSACNKETGTRTRTTAIWGQTARSPTTEENCDVDWELVMVSACNKKPERKRKRTM